MQTCKIQWIDDSGNPTPDDNPAIGTAFVIAHIDHAIAARGGNSYIEESKHFPICADHVSRLYNDEGMHFWRFTAFPKNA